MLKRQPIVKDGYIIVPLTRGFEALVDKEDLKLVDGYSWTAKVLRNRFGEVEKVYAKRGEKRDGKYKEVLMHRIILGTPEGLLTDHIDGDGLNNRRSNLRVATSLENARNQKIKRNNTTEFKGVTKRSFGRFQAQIRNKEGEKVYLGLFDTAEEAKDRYDSASKLYHGDFSNLG